MTDHIDSFEHRGLTIKIYQDPDAESPREWDNLGTMVCWHRRYSLGDEQPSSDPNEYVETLLPQDVVERLENRREREYCATTTDEGRKQAYADYRDRVMAEVEKHYLVLPLYLYDHSGITMRTSPFHCPWDSGQVGYIYVSLDDVRKEYNTRAVTKKVREKAIERLRGEVKVYARYLEGGFTGYVVEDEDGEVVDSCWGFDDPDYCREQAKDAADCEADNREEAAKSEAAEIEAESRAAGGL